MPRDMPEGMFENDEDDTCCDGRFGSLQLASSNNSPTLDVPCIRVCAYVMSFVDASREKVTQPCCAHSDHERRLLACRLSLVASPRPGKNRERTRELSPIQRDDLVVE